MGVLLKRNPIDGRALRGSGHRGRLPEEVSQAAAVGDLGCTIHPVVFRLALRLRGGTGVDLRGQRDRNRGEDQRGEKSLCKHDVSPLEYLGSGVRYRAACKHDYEGWAMRRG